MHEPEQNPSGGVTDPEGVIDALPAGGWEDARAADGTTAERARDLAESGTDVGAVEGDEPTQGADPDLSAADQDEEE
jgi:hypothetical protein